jgi:predicted nucleotidyltransferase
VQPFTHPAWLTPAESAAVSDFLNAVREILGDDLRAVRLFGSRARGEGTPDSDLDLALIVTPDGRARRHAVYDLAFDVGLRHGVQLAPTLMTEATLDMLRSRERMLAHELDRDGIPL